MNLAQQPPVSRFNQMLVVSVFFHALVMTGTLFLPKLEITPRSIQSAFRVQLVEVPAGNLKPAPAPAETSSAPETSQVAAPESAPKPQPKPVAEKPKPAPPPKPISKSKIPPKPVSPPKQVQTKQPKALIQELDQIASLASKPKVEAPPQSKDTFLEQRVRELEVLKQSTPKIPVKPIPPLLPETQDKQARPAPSVKTEKHLEFEKLMASPEKTQKPKTSAPQGDLFKELETLSQLKATETLVKPQPTPVMPKASPGDKPTSESSAEIRRLEEQRQQLASLKASDLKVKVDRGASTPSAAPAFKSQIHSLAAPDPTKSYVHATVPQSSSSSTGASKVLSQRAGTPGADLLSLYIGEVERKVLSNWKSPFGAQHNQLEASFYIYPQGKIDRPVLLKSSGNDMLDNLALRAISDSEPFPPFPSELKEPNLHITIHFHYVNHE